LASVMQLTGAGVSAVSVFVTLKIFHGGLNWAALAITVPVLAVNLWYLPRLLCRHLGQDLGTFYRSVAYRPLLYVLPFAVCLVAARMLARAHPMEAADVCAGGGVILAVFYWHKVLPERLKSAVVAFREKVIRNVAIQYSRI
jgi:hypothetical protein